jgi:CheY-like chemotaxis protein
MIVSTMLEITGIEIDEAENGQVVVDKFKSSPENYYDIIFMDVQMPRMNGYEAASAIRALEREDAKAVPIIALSANAFKEDIDNAKHSGMNDHMAKPVDMEKLIEMSCKYLFR